ncbi:single-stranded DNA-binding protein, partial [Bifidobacterium pseudocatenulatum]
KMQSGGYQGGNANGGGYQQPQQAQQQSQGADPWAAPAEPEF